MSVQPAVAPVIRTYDLVCGRQGLERCQELFIFFIYLFTLRGFPTNILQLAQYIFHNVRVRYICSYVHDSYALRNMQAM